MKSTVCYPPLFVDKAAHWLAEKARETRIPMLAAFIFSAFAYMFAFTNKLVNGDDVGCLFSKGATTTSGRWGLEVLSYILPNYSMPWLHGIITIGLLTVAICIMIGIFNIRSKLFQILLAGTVITFPSLTGTFGFMFTSSSYAVAFLFAVLAVWLLQRDSKKYFIPALACMSFSLGIYQAYVAVSASLLILILIQQLLYDADIAAIFRKGIRFLIFLIVSLAFYYAATQLFLQIVQDSFNSYASEAIHFSLSSIFTGILNAYFVFLDIFIEGTYGLIPTAFSQVIHILSVTFTAILLCTWLFSQKRITFLRVIFLLAMIALLPLAINCMFIFVSFYSVHTLVLYSFVAVYILAIIIAEACLPILLSRKLWESLRRLALNFIPIALAFVIICNIYIANKVSLKMYLEYENTYAFYSSLAADIKMLPGFNETTKLAVIGEYQHPYYIKTQFDDISRIAGTQFNPNIGSKQAFLEFYLGFSISLATEEEVTSLQNSQEYAEMATYPYYGSIQMIDNFVVVKLS